MIYRYCATMRTPSPGFYLFSAAFLCLLVIGTAAATVLSPPWLGVTLHDDRDADRILIESVHPSGPSRTMPADADHLVAVETIGHGRVDLVADDYVEEPDLLTSYKRIHTIFARQNILIDMLHMSKVTLIVADKDGRETRVDAIPLHRPVSDLPVAFWIQMIVGTGTMMISAWVWSLRRQEWSARFFGLTGLFVSLSSYSAAIYSSRELAIPGDLFRALSVINHAGAFGFGIFMIALFSVYPKRLFSLPLIWIMTVFFTVWFVVDSLHILPYPALGSQLGNSTQMLLIIAMICVQGVVTRHDARAHAALRWLGLSVVIGAGAFVTTMLAPVLLNKVPPMEQAYAFLFFLLVHSGIALGVSRYRLFELGEWSFRILFYTLAAFVLMGVDAVLIYGLHIAPMKAFGVALLVVTFGYVPLRDVLWRRFFSRNRVRKEEILYDIIDMAFGASDTERLQRWQHLLNRLFDPLEIRFLDDNVQTVDIREEGLSLVIPPVCGASPVLLRCPWGGRGLFGPEQVRLAEMIAALGQHADASRGSYERGVTEERIRIAQDLHDDVGARLMTSLHKKDLDETQYIVREAMADIRTIATGLSGQRALLDQVIADMRHETGRRLDAAGIALQWQTHVPQTDRVLEYQVYKNIVSVHREAISNILRHAHASRVEITIEMQATHLSLVVRDNGVGMTSDHPLGNGMTHMAKRVTMIGGTLEFVPVETGVCLCINVPLG